MGKFDEAIAEAERAFDIGKRFGDANLQALALVIHGRSLVYLGELDAGLALLDEASTSALTGELDPFSATVVYCMTITGAQGVGDFDRARQWTEAANRWCDVEKTRGFPEACRVHRSEILWLGGQWDEAEREAVDACSELESYNAFTTAAGYYQIGEIRRRRGDFHAAEEAYRKAHELGRDPQPGQALLRLAQGKAAEAAAALGRSLGDDATNPLARARRLPAQVAVSLAVGDVETARDGGHRARGADGSLPGRWRADAVARRCTSTRSVPHRDRRGGLDGRGGRSPDGAGDLEAGRRTVRGGRGTHRARHGLRAQGRPKGAHARVRGGEGDVRAPRGRARHAADDGAARRDGSHPSDLRLHGHRRLHEAAGGAGAGEVEEAPRPTRRVVERSDSLAWRRGDQADRRRLLRRVRHRCDCCGERRAHPASLADEVFSVRIGLHSGEALERGSDYTGRGVNVAARIGALAGAGEILVSTETLDGSSSPYALSEPRTAELKGFEEPVPIAAVEYRT